MTKRPPGIRCGDSSRPIHFEMQLANALATISQMVGALQWLDPGDERCGRGVRAAEALRCPADEVLSRQQQDQQRGQRRRSMPWTHANSGSSLFVVEGEC